MLAVAKQRSAQAAGDRKGNKEQVKILAAMSGGVDSSVAALLLHQAGHDVTGVTMKLWGGPSDSGCCSVSDVEDARRAANAVGIPHFVFNFGEQFQSRVVEPYVQSHQNAETPNPCIECNRHIKFDVLTERAKELAFDAVATGHYARIMRDESGTPWLIRAKDKDKDQSYVLNMLTAEDLEYTMFPIGELTKPEVREIAKKNGLRLADKPDSYEVCFIHEGRLEGEPEEGGDSGERGEPTGGRRKFLKDRLQLTPADVVDVEDTEGEAIGQVPALEMLTLGQRKGVGVQGMSEPRYVVDIQPASFGTGSPKSPKESAGINSPKTKVVLGKKVDLYTQTQPIRDLDLRLKEIVREGESATAETESETVLIQTSAHAQPAEGRLVGGAASSLGGAAAASSLGGAAAPPSPVIRWGKPQKRIAPGQSLVFYSCEPDPSRQKVLGAAIASQPNCQNLAKISPSASSQKNPKKPVSN